ncbi:hypothetical protein F5Y03DRAFT_210228 [Xylaria venustula]|nr:hypothetical protein F5Y03DRAFT_210228 [Xylaria venustula]
MATAPSQPPADSANAPASGTIRPPSTGPAIGASSLSKPHETDASLNTAPLAAPGSLPNDTSLVPLSTPPLNASPGTEMRIYPRDGRVRNPVPSKLKNVNEQMKGNFGVMHMDVVSHRATEGRDAAAKRTSEGTALQAKLAQTESYVSHQRRANYPKPPGLKQFSSPKKSDEPVAVVEPGPPRPLTVAQTKAEQARLLTTLRTIPHHVVVDQICKGVAFFGGLPDAPPPADGLFPESARANGSGSLFVGWIAEIFPDTSNLHPQSIEDPAALTAGQKRPRGRPKGSKARKTRSDKGLKKGPQKGSRGADDQAQDPQDDSWIDVDDSVLEMNNEADMADAMAALRDAPGISTGPNDGGASTTTPAKGSTASFRSINDVASLTARAKRRGRPKGSKNRPKDKSVLQSLIPPKITPVPVPVPMLNDQPKNKTSSTKAKQPKSRPKPTTESSNYTAPANNASQHVDSSAMPEHIPSAQAPPSALDFADEFAAPTANGAMTHNHESHQSGQAIAPTLPSPASQIKASTVTAKKRKRPGWNSTAQVECIPPPGAVPSSAQNQSNTMPVTSSAQLQNQATQHIHQPTPNSIAISATKRLRKSQDSPTIATVTRQTPNSMNQKTSIPPVSTLDDPAHEHRPEDVAQSHPEAEGLEAHYVSMHSNTDQMQNYNRPQHKPQPQSTSSIGSTVSPVPPTVSTATGLESRLEHFTALQNSTGRQKQQRSSQTASPIPTQPSNLPQMSAALMSQQQPRSAQNFYAQGQGLGSSYNTQQQQPYSNTQRSQQHMSSASPNTGLVPHVTNSPQFSTQSNSPLMQTESNFRGSPSLMHSNTPFGTRRPPSASPLDNSTTYRSTSATNHGVANQSPHFGTRQTSATATHNTSHSGLSSTFPNFSDPSLFELALDSGGGHGNMGIGGNSYGLNSNAVPQQQQQQQQRSSSSNAASLYSSSGINNTYLGSTNMGRTSQQPRWPS